MSRLAAATTEHPEATCLGCDYPLTGLTENRCPECGRVFDPRDPDTMRTARTPGKIARWLMQPPKWPSHVVTSFAALSMIASAAAPIAGGYFRLAIISAYIWMVLLPGWFLRALACVFLRLRSRNRTRSSFIHQMRWLWVPACLALTIALCSTSIPSRCAFVISRPAMDSLVLSVMSNPTHVHAPQWVGIFYAEDIEATPWGMKFTVSDNGYSVGGFSFMQTMPSDGPPLSNMKSLGRGWYSWVDGSN